MPRDSITDRDMALYVASQIDNHTHAVVLNTKSIDIGDWDMDATASVNVAHGLTLTKIRSVSVLIRNDDDDAYLDIIGTGNDIDAYMSSIDSTNVVLDRVGTGSFDGVNYDSTSYNRGWIVLQYVD